MEIGDIGVVFPDVIHHYQVFSSEVNEAVFINSLFGIVCLNEKHV